MSALDPVNSGVQAEGTKDVETEESLAEAPGGSHMEERCTEGSGMANQTEKVGTKEFGGDQAEEFQAGECEILGGESQLMEELDHIITKEKLGQVQRYDKELRVIREKAEKRE